jgi:hypothetical protein
MMSATIEIEKELYIEANTIECCPICGRTKYLTKCLSATSAAISAKSVIAVVRYRQSD